MRACCSSSASGWLFLSGLGVAMHVLTETGPEGSVFDIRLPSVIAPSPPHGGDHGDIPVGA